MLERDHFAAEIACIWTQIRVIECEMRSKENHKAYQAIDRLSQTIIDIERIMQKWEDKVGYQRKGRENGNTI